MTLSAEFCATCSLLRSPANVPCSSAVGRSGTMMQYCVLPKNEHIKMINTATSSELEDREESEQISYQYRSSHVLLLPGTGFPAAAHPIRRHESPCPDIPNVETIPRFSTLPSGVECTEKRKQTGRCCCRSVVPVSPGKQAAWCNYYRLCQVKARAVTGSYC